MEISGRSFCVWYYVVLGGLWWANVLNSALPPQRHRPDTRPEHQDPVSHTPCVLLRALLSNILIVYSTTLLSNWELRWMGFLTSPDGLRLQFLFLETPPPPYFYYYFCKKSIKRVEWRWDLWSGKPWTPSFSVFHLSLSLISSYSAADWSRRWFFSRFVQQLHF